MGDFAEPRFEMDRDYVVVSKDAGKFTDEDTGDGPKVNVLILSYNRPNMLKQAIASVLSQNYQNMEVFVVDDGSDFDVERLVAKFRDKRLSMYLLPRIPLEERLTMSRIGGALNEVVALLDKDEVVTYLCDDDILSPQWIPRMMLGFAKFPDYHVVAGEPWCFEDGKPEEAWLGMRSKENPSIPTMFWVTGSFAHMASCFTDEGLRWKDNKYLHSQDTNFISELWELHPNYLYIPVPAVYRREHPKALSSLLGRKDEFGRYKPGYVPPPADESHIRGMME